MNAGTTDSSPEAPSPSRLARRLGMTDAVMIGLGSMIGAGVFSAIGPAARAAGTAACIGLAIAAFVAYCNATSSADLAALYPESGGSYVYGRKRLGALWGFVAGWGFVTGKLASCTAMALTFAGYADPAHAKLWAAGAVLALTAVNYFGVKKSALLTRAIVVFVLGSLALVVTAILAGGRADPRRLLAISESSFHGILQSAGILFFAFAGYARIATLGEEVVDPRRTIPRAIPIALGITLVVYAAVVISVLLAVDVPDLVGSPAPLALAVEAGGAAWMSPIVRIGASVASLGVLLSLLVGVSRTTFAMASNRALPALFARVHPSHRVPHFAEIGAGLLVAIATMLGDIRSAIGFSSFNVLAYYAIANASALTLKPERRRWPRFLPVAGLAGCVLLAINLPASSVVAGSAVMLAGAAFFLARNRSRAASRAG